MSHSYRPLRFNEFKKYPICVYPWYKERIQTKYLNTKLKNHPTFLNPRDWMFLRVQNDKADENCPPFVDENFEIVKGSGSTGPNLLGESNKRPMRGGHLPKLNGETTCSRESDLMRERRNNIQEVELGLIQHPLALYSHLEASVSPEIYEDIVDIVDPEMNISSLDDDEDDTVVLSMSTRSNTSARTTERQAKTTAVSPVKESTEEISFGQPQLTYRWTFKKEERDRKKRLLTDPKPETIAENEHIRSVTREFCDWVAGLGGEANNIEQPTVTSLFASGYETKPALSVPIHVIELASVPPELRGNVSQPPPQQSQHTTVKTELPNATGSSSTTLEKARYGAWYLRPQFWKVMPANEPLEDPRTLHNEKQDERRAKFDRLNHELCQLQSPSLFEQFVDRTGTEWNAVASSVTKRRKPKFLEEIADLRRDMETTKIAAETT